MIHLATAFIAVHAPATNPCRIVGKNDILRILGWHVEHVRERRYRFGALSGDMCNQESPEGIVTTILPAAGSSCPGITPDNAPDAGELVTTEPGHGGDAQIFSGGVYVVRNHRRACVRVVPETHPASNADVQPFANVIRNRLH